MYGKRRPVSPKYRAIRLRVVVSGGRAYILILFRFGILEACLAAVDPVAVGDGGWEMLITALSNGMPGLNWFAADVFDPFVRAIARETWRVNAIFEDGPYE